MAAARAPAQYYAGKQEYKESRVQAEIVKKEGQEAAKQKLEEGKTFEANQEMAYLKSGVMLSGSPLIVMAETREKNLEEATRIRQSAYTQAEGLQRRGRAAYISGLLTASGSIGQTAGKAAAGGG